MEEMQNTGNAVPSNDLKDFNDNLIVLDNQMNSQELVTVDRLGRQIVTVKGMEKKMEDLASNISTDKLVPIDGSRAADKLTLKDSDSSLELKAESGELKVGDKTALLATETDGVKTVAEPTTFSGDTNFTGALQNKGSDVITEAMNVAYITETFLSDDGLSGYEKWSDGKVTQWGQTIGGGSTSSRISVNLLIELKNNEYIVEFSTTAKSNIKVIGESTGSSYILYETANRWGFSENQTTKSFECPNQYPFNWRITRY